MADTLVMYEKDGYDTDELISATNVLKDQIVYMWQCVLMIAMKTSQ